MRKKNEIVGLGISINDILETSSPCVKILNAVTIIIVENQLKNEVKLSKPYEKIIENLATTLLDVRSHLDNSVRKINENYNYEEI